MNDPRPEGHMASYIRRRKFLALLGGAAVAWPPAARAQQAGKLPTVGFLGTTTPSIMSQWTAAFVGRMRELGWIEGRTIKIEYGWAEGHGERYAEIAAEFVRLKVDVIVTTGPAAPQAKKATSVNSDCSRTVRRPSGRWPGCESSATGRQHHRPVDAVG